MARERISKGTRDAMIFVAIFFWAISFIPVVNFLSNPLGWIIMWMWFKTHGASLTKNKTQNIASIAVGFIPVLGTLLSAFPLVIHRNIKAVEKEDKAT